MSGTPAKSLPDAWAATAAPPSAPSPRAGSSSLPPPTIPDHTIVCRIGGGSYGEVWLARSVLGELRAVKVISRSRFNDDRPFEREFEGIQRFEPISRSHPSQLAILHVGKNDDAGCFNYVMELADAAEPRASDPYSVISDQSSASKARASSDTSLKTDSLITDYAPRTLRHDLQHRGRLPIADCVQIGLSLTTALAHLHQHGLVHRDIKPSNVIFVNGVPKLGDIGLVTEAGDTQSIVGTEGYIPPEGPGTPQSDIFGLGKVLYEISTGMDRRRFAELPEDLRTWQDRSAVVEFNEIVLKACAKDPARRYQSTEEMGADLELLQSGKSVKRKRTGERRRSIAKKICVAAAVLGLTAAAVTTLVREIWRETSNTSYRLSTNPLANKEYAEGIQCYRRDNREGLQQGLAHFNRAIEIDPTFTMAYNGLFEVYIGGDRLGLSRAETWAKLRGSARKLMELDPTLAEAQAAQAWLDFLDWRWETAEPRFRHAILIDPKCAIAHMRYGFCLVFAGRPDEGLKELQTAEILDPTLPHIKKNIGNVFYVKRKFREAIEQCQRAIDLEPSYPYAHELIASAYRALGSYTNAIDEFEKYEIAVGKDRAQVKKQFDELRRVYADGGPPGYWLKCLEEAQESGDLRSQARCYAYLNDYDQAIILLEKAYATNELESLESLLWNECWDSVHDNPRFIALLKKTGLKK